MSKKGGALLNGATARKIFHTAGNVTGTFPGSCGDGYMSKLCGHAPVMPAANKARENLHNVIFDDVTMV